MIDEDRKRSRSGEVGDLENFSDSFFFCNFPESCEIRDFWREFNKIGKVLDVFISKKRTQKGSRFGFVRFKKGNNINQIEADLGDIWFGSYRLRANISKFKRNPLSSKGQPAINESNSGQGISNIVKGRSYSDVVRSPLCRTDNRPPDFAQEKISTKEVCIEPLKESLNFVSTEEDWLSRCLVGELKNDALLKNIENLLKLEIFSFDSIRSLGGRRVLLEFSSTENMNKVMESCEGSNQWFGWLKRWESKFSQAGRIAKLRCFGVPLQAWNKHNFHKIGELLGEVVEVDEETINKHNLVYGSIRIFTNDWSPISHKIINVQVENNDYSVLIHEESQMQDGLNDFRFVTSDRDSSILSSDGFFTDSGDDELPESHGSVFSDEEVDQRVSVQQAIFESCSGAELEIPSGINKKVYIDGEEKVKEIMENVFTDVEERHKDIIEKMSTDVVEEDDNSNVLEQCKGGDFPSNIDRNSSIKEMGHYKNMDCQGAKLKHKPLSEILSKLDGIDGTGLKQGSKQNKGRKKKSCCKNTCKAPQIDGVSISDGGIRNMVRIVKDSLMSGSRLNNSEDLEKTMLLADELGINFENIKDEELVDLFG